MRARVAWWSSRLFALALATGCQRDEAVRTESILLAEGEFHGLDWGGTQEERFYTLARRGLPSEGDTPLALVSAEHERAPCELGANVVQYSRLRPRSSAKFVLGSPSPTLIPLFDELDADGYGTLAFADIACQRIDFTVPDVSSSMWVMYSPDLSSAKLGVFTRDAKLIFVDPWARAQQEVANGLQLVQGFDTGVWTVEKGQVVKRDYDAHELQRRGSGVTQFSPFGGGDDVAYIDERGASAVRSGKVKELPSDLCGDQISGADAFLPGAITFYAPCDTRTLHVDTEDKRYDYGDNVGLVRIVSGLLLYTSDDDEGNTTAWIVRNTDPGKPVQLLKRPKFLTDYVLWQRTEQLLLLVRGKDNVTSVWQVDLDNPSFPVAELTTGVVGYQFAPEGVAALYATGQLVVTDRTLSKVVLSVPDAARSKFTLAFRNKAAGIAYLTDVDPDTQLGYLQLHLFNGDHFALAPDVREFSEVWWPERGFVYATGGASAGIYFARVEIPCETTSDTAWACGF